MFFQTFFIFLKLKNFKIYSLKKIKKNNFNDLDMIDSEDYPEFDPIVLKCINFMHLGDKASRRGIKELFQECLNRDQTPVSSAWRVLRFHIRLPLHQWQN